MKCTLLGTSSAVGMPAPLNTNETYNKRTRPSLLIETDNVTLLFDASPDIKQQSNNRFDSLDGVFLTHHHHDHASGLREINHTTLDSKKVVFNPEDIELDDWLNKEYAVYCSKQTLDLLKTNMNYVINNDNMEFRIIKDSEKIFIDNLKITPFKTNHTDGYLGYKIESDNKCVVYHPDYGKLDTNVEFNNVDTLVVDGGAAVGMEIHNSKQELIELINNINADNLLFTNVSEFIIQSSTDEMIRKSDWSDAIVEDGYTF